MRIENHQQHEDALKLLEKLIWQDKPSDHNRVETLAREIERYEEIHWPVK